MRLRPTLRVGHRRIGVSVVCRRGGRGGRGGRSRGRSGGRAARGTARPIASHSLGYIEIGVKPGIVLSSFTRNAPSSRRKKSTRAIASHRHASNARTASARTSAVCASVERRRHEQLGLAVLVLVGVVVEVGGRDHLARAATPRAGRRRAPPTSISRPTTVSSAMIHSSNSNACAIAARELGARRAPCDTPTDEPMFDGFTKHGQPELGLDPVRERVGVVRRRAARGSAPAAARRPRTPASS